MAYKNSQESAIKSYLQNLICITASLAVFALSGCAAPQTVLPVLDRFLSPPCKKLMTSEVHLQYGQNANNLFSKAVFAVATEGDKQVCSWSTDSTAGVWETLDSAALGRCNVLRPQYGISSPCGIFAHNWDILWTGSTYPGPMPDKTQRPVSIDGAKSKCTDLGIKAGTQKFSDCVLGLSQ